MQPCAHASILFPRRLCPPSSLTQRPPRPLRVPGIHACVRLQMYSAWGYRAVHFYTTDGMLQLCDSNKQLGYNEHYSGYALAVPRQHPPHDSSASSSAECLVITPRPLCTETTARCALRGVMGLARRRGGTAARPSASPRSSGQTVALSRPQN